MARLAIDFKAAQLFFSLIKQSNGVLFCQNYIDELVDKIAGRTTTCASGESLEMLEAMKCRGLLLMMSFADMGSTSWHLVTLHILKSLALQTVLAEEEAGTTKKKEKKLRRPLDLVVAHQPKLVIIDLIMQLQDLLTNMVLFSGGQELHAELFELAVRMLDYLYRINKKFKPASSQIEAKDFVNQAVSSTLDFTGPVQIWSKRMLSKVRNDGRDIASELFVRGKEAAPFCVISYPWLFSTESKQRILKEHIKFDRKLSLSMLQLTDLWAAQVQARPVQSLFVCNVKRENLLG